MCITKLPSQCLVLCPESSRCLVLLDCADLRLAAVLLASDRESICPKNRADIMPIRVRGSVIIRHWRLRWESFSCIRISAKELAKLCLHTWASARQKAR